MATGLLLMAFLGLCGAHQGHNHGANAEHSTDTLGKEDITQIIQRMNNASNEYYEGDLMRPKTRSAMKCADSPFSCRWPKSNNGKVEIAYVLSDRYDSVEKNEIVRALKDFETKTCIRFNPRQADVHYLLFEPHTGCGSLLGRNGYKQTVSLAKFGCVYFGIIQHEVMHALGFHHEHNRSDRDQYVQIHMDRIMQSFKHNFEKKDSDNMGTPYDYSSIMHYSRNGFGEKQAETITPIPDPNVPIGQRDQLSRLDVLKINLLYKC
uniref:Metalloendopeptidase n=1 Tax=Neogobius melanostomus TaxID=47308 RepID=A0A8C6TWB0_9GOBI